MFWSRFQGLKRSIRCLVSIGTATTAVCLLAAALSLCGCSPPRGVYHTVQRGQTLYRIGQIYGVEPDYLSRVNGIRDPSQLKVGQRLFIPGAGSLRYVQPTVATSHPAGRKLTAKKNSPSPASRSRTGPVRQAPSKNTLESNATGAGKSSRKSIGVEFIWPVRGKLVKSFGQQGYGGRKGIEIEVQPRQKIAAAAAGRVTYSGNGIKGYGNLIILKHAEDLFSVYGFNQENLVSVGSYVSKGESIALAGAPPGCGDSRLHFEIRQGKDALNPVSFLP